MLITIQAEIPSRPPSQTKKSSIMIIRICKSFSIAIFLFYHLTTNPTIIDARPIATFGINAVENPTSLYPLKTMKAPSEINKIPIAILRIANVNPFLFFIQSSIYELKEKQL